MEKEERTKRVNEKRRLQAEEKEANMAEKQAQMELKNDIARRKSEVIQIGSKSIRSKKPQRTKKVKENETHDDVDAKGVEEPIFRTSKGRRVQRSKRLDL